MAAEAAAQLRVKWLMALATLVIVLSFVFSFPFCFWRSPEGPDENFTSLFSPFIVDETTTIFTSAPTNGHLHWEWQILLIDATSDHDSNIHLNGGEQAR